MASVHPLSFLNPHGSSSRYFSVTLKIRRRILLQCGDSCLAQRKAYEWAELFINGRTSVVDKQRPGRPRTAPTDRNTEKVEKLIRADRRLTVDEIADKLGISHGSVHTIIHKKLKFKKVCTRWVPRELTTEHKKIEWKCAPGYWNGIKRKVRHF
jgi:hypothetical protein